MQWSVIKRTASKWHSHFWSSFRKSSRKRPRESIRIACLQQMAPCQFARKNLVNTATLMFIIEKKVAELKDQYNTTRNQSKLQLLNSELAAVEHILAKDLEMIMDRDKTINNIGAKAAALKQKSAELRGKASQLKWQFIMRRYYLLGIFVVIFGAIAAYLFIE